MTEDVAGRLLGAGTTRTQKADRGNTPRPPGRRLKCRPPPRRRQYPVHLVLRLRWPGDAVWRLHYAAHTRGVPLPVVVTDIVLSHLPAVPSDLDIRSYSRGGVVAATPDTHRSGSQESPPCQPPPHHAPTTPGDTL